MSATCVTPESRGNKRVFYEEKKRKRGPRTNSTSRRGELVIMPNVRV